MALWQKKRSRIGGSPSVGIRFAGSVFWLAAMAGPGALPAEETGPCLLDQHELLRSANSVQPPTQGRFVGQMSSWESEPGQDPGSAGSQRPRELLFEVTISGDNFLMRYDKIEMPRSAHFGTFSELVLLRKGRRVDLLRQGESNSFIATEHAYADPDTPVISHRGTAFHQLMEAGIARLTCEQLEGRLVHAFDVREPGREARAFTLYRERNESYAVVFVGTSGAARGRLLGDVVQVGPELRITSSFEDYQPTGLQGRVYPRTFALRSFRTNPSEELLGRIRSGAVKSYEAMPQVEGTLASEILFSLTDVDLSSSIDPSVFEIDYPDGTRVISYTEDSAQDVIVHKNLGISQEANAQLLEEVKIAPPAGLVEAKTGAAASAVEPTATGATEPGAASVAPPAEQPSGGAARWLRLALAAVAGAAMAGVAMWLTGRSGKARGAHD